MPICKVTVLKCLFDAELKAQYVPDPDYGACPFCASGDVFYSDHGEQPENFRCKVGWSSIAREAARFAQGQGGPGGGPQILCCNDGIRPVIFRLETVEEITDK